MQSKSLNTASVVVYAAAISILAVNAYAVIGETDDGLIFRHGKPSAGPRVDESYAPVDKVQVMEWRGLPNYDLVVCMVNGRSVREIYTLRKPIDDSNNPIMQQVLVENVRGEQGAWGLVPEAKMALVNAHRKGIGKQPVRYLFLGMGDWEALEACLLSSKEQQFEVISREWWQR